MSLFDNNIELDDCMMLDRISWLSDKSNIEFRLNNTTYDFKSIMDRVRVLPNGFIDARCTVAVNRNLPDYIKFSHADLMVKNEGCDSFSGFPNQVGSLMTFGKFDCYSIPECGAMYIHDCNMDAIDFTKCHARDIYISNSSVKELDNLVHSDYISIMNCHALKDIYTSTWCNLSIRDSYMLDVSDKVNIHYMDVI